MDRRRGIVWLLVGLAWYVYAVWLIVTLKSCER